MSGTSALHVLEDHSKEKSGCHTCQSTACAGEEKSAWNSILGTLQVYSSLTSGLSGLHHWILWFAATCTGRHKPALAQGMNSIQCPRTQKSISWEKRMWVVYAWWSTLSGRSWHLPRMSRLTTLLLQNILWVNLKWLQMVRCWFCMSSERQYCQQNSAF